MTIEYKLSKHRFYELKHFCLQYGEWQFKYLTFDGWPTEANKNEGDTTSRDGISRADLMRNMQMINDVVDMTCPEEYQNAMFACVTQGIRPRLTRDELDFWHYYRKFFWELSKRRG